MSYKIQTFYVEAGKINLPVRCNQYRRTTKVQFLTNKIPSKSYNCSLPGRKTLYILGFLIDMGSYIIVSLTLSTLIYQEGGKDTGLKLWRALGDSYKYLRRTRKLLETKLCSRNLIKEINTCAIHLVRYSGSFLKWIREKLQQKNQKTKKLKTILEIT